MCNCGKKRRVVQATLPDAQKFLVPDAAALVPEPYDEHGEDTVLVGVKESMEVELWDKTYQWKAGQTRQIPKYLAERLVAQGAPVWTIS